MGLYFHVKSVKSETERAICCILTDGDKQQWIPRSVVVSKIGQEDMTFKVYIRDIPKDKQGKLADLYNNDFLYEDEVQVGQKALPKAENHTPGRFIEPGAPVKSSFQQKAAPVINTPIPPVSVDPGFDSIEIDTEAPKIQAKAAPQSIINQNETHSLNEILEVLTSIKVREERTANELQNIRQQIAKPDSSSKDITLKIEISEETRCFLGGFMQLGTQLVTRLNQLCLMMDTSSLEPQVPAEKSQPVINK